MMLAHLQLQHASSGRQIQSHTCNIAQSQLLVRQHAAIPLLSGVTEILRQLLHRSLPSIQMGLAA